MTTLRRGLARMVLLAACALPAASFDTVPPVYACPARMRYAGKDDPQDPNDWMKVARW